TLSHRLNKLCPAPLSPDFLSQVSMGFTRWTDKSRNARPARLNPFRCIDRNGHRGDSRRRVGLPYQEDAQIGKISQRSIFLHLLRPSLIDATATSSRKSMQ